MEEENQIPKYPKQLEMFQGLPHSHCTICGKPLTDINSVRRGMGKICNNRHGETNMANTDSENQYDDEYLDADIKDHGVVWSRLSNGRLQTNVPHLATHHSPTGFEVGYGGSGPADFALNIAEWYLRNIKYNDTEEVKVWDKRRVKMAAWNIHQKLKVQFICTANKYTGHIPYKELAVFMREHVARYEDGRDHFSKVAEKQEEQTTMTESTNSAQQLPVFPLTIIK